jgi:hypothetical protein
LYGEAEISIFAKYGKFLVHEDWHCEIPVTLTCLWGARSSLVVEALCYKPEDRWFETRLGEWICFSLPNPSGRTMPLGFTQPLTNERQKQKNNVSGD